MKNININQSFIKNCGKSFLLVGASGHVILLVSLGHNFLGNWFVVLQCYKDSLHCYTSVET